MKTSHIFLLNVLLLLALVGHSQTNCNCQKIDKNGVIIFQCQTLPVAYDNSTQIGLGIGSINKNPCLSLTVRFKNAAMELDKSFELHFWLEDGNVVDLEYLNGGLAYMGNSQVAQGVYLISSDQQSNLQASKIKTVAFKLSDGLRRSYQVKMNPDILSNQLKCLD